METQSQNPLLAIHSNIWWWRNWRNPIPLNFTLFLFLNFLFTFYPPFFTLSLLVVWSHHVFHLKIRGRHGGNKGLRVDSVLVPDAAGATGSLLLAAGCWMNERMFVLVLLGVLVFWCVKLSSAKASILLHLLLERFLSPVIDHSALRLISNFTVVRYSRTIDLSLLYITYRYTYSIPHRSCFNTTATGKWIKKISKTYIH